MNARSAEEISSSRLVSGPDDRRPGHTARDGNKGGGALQLGMIARHDCQYVAMSADASRRAFFPKAFTQCPGPRVRSLGPRHKKNRPMPDTGRLVCCLNRRRVFRQRPVALRQYVPRRFRPLLRTVLQYVPTHRRAATRPCRQAGLAALASSPVASRDWPHNPRP